MGDDDRSAATGQAELDRPVSPVARDVAYVGQIADPALREVVACSLRQYRQPDRLSLGDPVPPLELAALDGAGPVRLDRYAGERPLVLLFGSYT